MAASGLAKGTALLLLLPHMSNRDQLERCVGLYETDGRYNGMAATYSRRDTEHHTKTLQQKACNARLTITFYVHNLHIHDQQ